VLLLVMFGLGALALWAGSEPVLPAYVLGMILAGAVGAITPRCADYARLLSVYSHRSILSARVHSSLSQRSLLYQECCSYC
jgi:hypothetical protein